METPLNLPCEERLAREVVASLQGILFSRNFDASSVSLDKVLSPRESHIGIRMTAATEGPGSHQDLPYVNCDVPEDWVYATFDTASGLAGSLSTYRLQKTPQGLVFRGKKNHRISFA